MHDNFIRENNLPIQLTTYKTPIKLSLTMESGKKVAESQYLC